MFGESKKRAGGVNPLIVHNKKCLHPPLGGGSRGSGARFPPPLVRAVMWRRMPVKMLTMRMMLTRMPTRMMKERNPDKEVCCLASFCCC